MNHCKKKNVILNQTRGSELISIYIFGLTYSVGCNEMVFLTYVKYIILIYIFFGYIKSTQEFISTIVLILSLHIA